MNEIKKFKALGLMSGTALNGVDIAMLETDGVDIYKTKCLETVPYDEGLVEKIRRVIGIIPDSGEHLTNIEEASKELTIFHSHIIEEFLKYNDTEVDIIGFHGHTIVHNPDTRYSYQLGNGKLLAELVNIPIVSNFHKADILAGGQGAPLYPVYFEALCSGIEKPVAVLNIGGISSITLLGQHGEMMAFDIGPGNAAINDWTMRKAGLHMDYNGKLAITGAVNEKIVANLMRNKFFAKYPPKAADRSIFQDKLEHLEGLSLEDGAATVTAFVTEAISYSMSLYLPTTPKELIICGGGAKNPTLKRFLRQRLEGIEVKGGEEYGWDDSSIEAQSMAYLAVRHLNNMPSTFPNTTGAQASIIAGDLDKPQAPACKLT